MHFNEIKIFCINLCRFNLFKIVYGFFIKIDYIDLYRPIRTSYCLILFDTNFYYTISLDTNFTSILYIELLYSSYTYLVEVMYI